ncbi:Arc family DNA-binding protein [Xenorhabdus bovienii]|uniref:Arc family DNA-binding protein n=1 Tax=Xenorhabdus bovienii TaxID=40576 RepID=UPI0023B2B876|nr:Arc family DNA-binding protein [Xenorhabdus bovienii]MDE9543840.1 Arc family DNA-binding protein [Xenorhabdus bovienii]
MSKRDIQLNIRITQELKDKIDDSAKKNNRSINAEAITLIEQSLPDQNAHKAIQPNDEKQPDIRDELREELKGYLEKELIKNKEMVEKTIDCYLKGFLGSFQDKGNNDKK